MGRIVALFAFLGLGACSQINSNEVDNRAIYGSFNISREEGANAALASATFYVGGKTGTVLKLENPSTITINNVFAAMSEDPMTKLISYVTSVPVTDDLVTFVFTDRDNNNYTNTLLMPGTLNLQPESGTVSRSQGFAFLFSSDKSFLRNEQLEIEMAGTGTTSYTQMGLDGISTSGNKFISSSMLRSFGIGSITIKACRAYKPYAQNPLPKGTDIELRSCSRSKLLTLVP